MKCNTYICRHDTTGTPRRRITLEAVMAGIALLAALLLPTVQHTAGQKNDGAETRIAACGTVFSEYMD